MDDIIKNIILAKLGGQPGSNPRIIKIFPDFLNISYSKVLINILPEGSLANRIQISNIGSKNIVFYLFLGTQGIDFIKSKETDSFSGVCEPRPDLVSMAFYINKHVNPYEFSRFLLEFVNNTTIFKKRTAEELAELLNEIYTGMNKLRIVEFDAEDVVNFKEIYEKLGFNFKKISRKVDSFI